MRCRLNRIRAVIFDLDGTLVDSAPDLIGALDTLLVAHGRAPIGLAAGRALIGEGAAKLVERGFAARGGLPLPVATLVPAFIDLYEARLTCLTRPFAGVPETLAALAAADLALGICTNKPDRATATLLETLDLSRHFAAIIGGDGRRKPDPEPVLRCLAALGTTPDTTLFVGDSPVDHQAARAAGLPVALVSFGYTTVPVRSLGPDHVLEDFAALRRLLGA